MLQMTLRNIKNRAGRKGYLLTLIFAHELQT